MLDWDPSKWIILALHRLGLVKGLRRAREEDIQLSKSLMDEKYKDGSGIRGQTTGEEEWKGAAWDRSQLENYVQSGQSGRTVLLLDGYVLQVAEYMKEHVGLPTAGPYPASETHDSCHSLAARGCFGDTHSQSPAGRLQTGLSTAGSTTTRQRRKGRCDY